MQKRLLIQIGLLEALAFALANLQAIGGVRTDEAKYLLNIPYPHPPLGRFTFHLFEWFPSPEMLWRFLLASIVVQSVWIVWDMAKNFSHRDRSAIAAMWLLSAAVFTQAGTVMMAPLTAVHALVLVWLRVRITSFVGTGKEALKLSPLYAVGIACFWLAALFTTHHILLFTPIVWSIFTRLKRPTIEKLLYTFGPLAALGLYIVSHPLILSSFIGHTSGQIRLPLYDRALRLVWFWVLAGSFAGTIAGVAGLLKSRSWALLLSAFLVSLILPEYTYYAIFVTPLIIAGLYHAHAHFPLQKIPFLPILGASAIVLIAYSAPWSIEPVSKKVSAFLDKNAGTGTILIVGSYGHEWQYENTRVVRKFQPALLPKASAVVCLESCRTVELPGFALHEKSTKLFKGEVWLKKDQK